MNQKHNKQDIIARGEALFRRRGYHNTGINEILKDCSISKGVFYNYFSSKEDYLIQSVVYYGERMYVHIAHFLQDRSRPPIERLRALYQSLMDYAVAENCEYGCLVYNLSFEVAGMSKEVARELDVQFERWLELVTACIEEGQQDGSIITDQPAYELASVLHTSVNGAHGRVKSRRSIEPMELMVNTLLAMMST